MPAFEDLSMAKRKYRQGPFSDAEVRLIRRLFPKTETVEMAARLNRSLTSVKAKLRELGLYRRSENIWSKREIAQLKRLYPATSMWTIANQLGLKFSHVRRKARQLRLRKK